MKKFLESLESFIIAARKFFTPHEVFFKLVDKYKKEVIKEYYTDLFYRFFHELKSISFWVSIFYNKSNGFIVNIFKILLLAPLFRFILVIIYCVKNFLYSFYFLGINFMFDLIIKYVDVYARKIRVFYDKSLIEEINEVRRILLFINVKENFKKIFKSAKDINVEGFIYKEEFHIRYKRIFFDVLLFFIWHMPLILGFISYLVRVFFAVIWGYFLIVFWYFAKKFTRVFKRAFIRFHFFYKIYPIKFKRISKKRYRILFSLKRNLILKVNKLNLFFSMLVVKLYDNISVWFKLRNSILRKFKYRFFSSIVSLIKNGNIEFFKYKLYRSKYDSLLIRALEISITENIFINIFAHVKKYVDDFIIDRFEPLNYTIKHMDLYLNKREISKLNILRFGSILNKLNSESISAMIHKFISTYNLDYYDVKKLKFKFKYIDRYRLIIYRYLLLIYWELIFPIYYLFYCIVVRVSFIIYLGLCFFFYIIRCLLILLLWLLRFIYCILVIIFAGKQK